MIRTKAANDAAKREVKEVFVEGYRKRGIPVVGTALEHMIDQSIETNFSLPAPKKQLTLRLDVDVIEKFRATGKGWQARMNDALRKAMP